MDGQEQRQLNQEPETVQQPSAQESAEPPPDYSTADYDNYQPPPKPKRNLKKPLLVLLALLVASATAFVVYSLLFKKEESQPPNLDQPCQNGLCQERENQAKPIVTNTKNYSSQSFTLSFDYPEDWTVKDEGEAIMTVRSPAVDLLDATGQKISGQITLTFRGKTQKLTEFDAGSAVAVKDSEKIAYTKPTQTQRGSTYLSFLRYAKTASANGLDGVYITGDAGYKTEQNIPKDDILKVDPVVSLTFAKCADSACVETSSTTIALASWNDASFSGPLLAMLKSLTIQ